MHEFPMLNVNRNTRGTHLSTMFEYINFIVSMKNNDAGIQIVFLNFFEGLYFSRKLNIKTSKSKQG